MDWSSLCCFCCFLHGTEKTWIARRLFLSSSFLKKCCLHWIGLVKKKKIAWNGIHSYALPQQKKKSKQQFYHTWLLKWKAEQVITSLLFLWRKAMTRCFGGQCWQRSDTIWNHSWQSKKEIHTDFITCVVNPDSDISCETYSGECVFLRFTHIMYVVGTPYLFTVQRRLIGGQNDCFMYSEVSRCIWSFVTEDCITCMVILQHHWWCYNGAPGPRRH